MWWNLLLGSWCLSVVWIPEYYMLHLYVIVQDAEIFHRQFVIRYEMQGLWANTEWGHKRKKLGLKDTHFWCNYCRLILKWQQWRNTHSLADSHVCRAGGAVQPKMCLNFTFIHWLCLWTKNTLFCLFEGGLFSEPGLLRRQWACWGNSVNPLYQIHFLAT